MVTVPEANYYYENWDLIDPIDSLNTVSFELGETEVTYELWYAVRLWAEDNGYRFQNEGCEGSSGTAGAEPTEAKLEPVTCVSWIDCVVWLNALSEMTGKEPVYLDTNGSVHRDATGSAEEIFAPENVVEAETDGYGLPSSMEWVAAARYIDGVNWTNRENASGASEDVENQEATEAVAVYNTGRTTPVATKKPNALGIYDMSGNVWEWCFDAYEPSEEDNRIIKGGAWNSQDLRNLQVKNYGLYCINPNYHDTDTGLRSARSLPAAQGNT
jgi:formylglycine-generating enzyme required for sulfatase activity